MVEDNNLYIISEPICHKPPAYCHICPLRENPIRFKFVEAIQKASGAATTSKKRAEPKSQTSRTKNKSYV